MKTVSEHVLDRLTMQLQAALVACDAARTGGYVEWAELCCKLVRISQWVPRWRHPSHNRPRFIRGMPRFVYEDVWDEQQELCITFGFSKCDAPIKHRHPRYRGENRTVWDTLRWWWSNRIRPKHLPIRFKPDTVEPDDVSIVSADPEKP